MFLPVIYVIMEHIQNRTIRRVLFLDDVTKDHDNLIRIQLSPDQIIG